MKKPGSDDQATRDPLLFDTQALWRLLNALPDAIVIADALTGRVCWANATAGRLFGGSPEGRQADELHSAAGREAGMAAFRAVAEGHLTEATVQTETLGLDGGSTPVEVRGLRLERPEGALVLGVLRDLSARRAAQQGREAAEQRLTAIIEGIPVGLVAADALTRRFIFTNRAFERLLAASPGGLIGKDPSDIHPPEAMERVAAEFQKMMAGDSKVALDLPVLRQDGTVFPADVHRVGILLDDRPAVLAAFTDQSTRSAQAQLLAVQQARLDGALSAAKAGWSSLDLASGQVFPDSHWLALRGAPPAPPEGLSLEDVFSFVHPDDLPELLAAGQACVDGRTTRLDQTFRVRLPNGKIRWLRSLAQITRRDGQGAALEFSGLELDVTEQRTLADRLAHASRRDLLTGLPNRAALTEALQTAMVRDARAGRSLAVACLDLDGFSALDRRCGAAAADEVLQHIGHRLQVERSDPMHLARLGGDEFAVVLSRPPGPEGWSGRARMLLDVVARPLHVAGEIHHLTACVGLAVYPQASEVNPDKLLRQAGEALAEAKRAGPNQVRCFDLRGDRQARLRREAVAELAQAMASGALCLYYQPKVHLQTGALWGLEALLRWRHPERGLLAPGAFLPALEGDPILHSLGSYVLSAALRQLSAWRSAGLFTSVSVNIDAVELRDPDFALRVLAALDAHPEVNARQVEVELLESSALGDLDEIRRQLNILAARGVSASLDDFGTGFASLSLLTRLPVSTVKLDQSFVRGIPDSLENAMAIDAVVGLARGLDRVLLAEGIETEDQGAHLIELGCLAGQGFFIARPMPPEDVLSWCAAWRPPERWQHAQPVSTIGRRLLLIDWQHHAWLRRLAAHAAQPQEVPPPVLAERDCRVGRWLRQDGLRGFEALRQLHAQLHARAEAWITGVLGDSEAGWGSIEAASQAFITELTARRGAEAMGAGALAPLPTPAHLGGPLEVSQAPTDPSTPRGR